MNIKSVLIAGHGRSGTNWLLDVLDQSSATFCANERNEVCQSLMSELPDPSIDWGQYSGLESAWDWIVEETKHRFGERDPVSGSKSYLYSGLRGKLLHIFRTRQRLRALASIFHKSLSGEEWPAPPSLVKRKEMEEALLVLKINQCPALACWLLRNFAGKAVLIHILRHPGGVLNSWQRRFLDGKNEIMVSVNDRNRLESILALDKGVSATVKAKITDFLNQNKNDTFHSAALYWLYANERIYECGRKINGSAPGSREFDPRKSDNYLFVNYESFCKDPENVSKKLYSRLDLAFDENVKVQISRKSKDSVDISDKWKKSMPRERRMMVEDLLEGTLFEKMWH